MKQDIRIITPLELAKHAWRKLGEPQSNTKIKRDLESGAIQLNGIKLKPEYKILILDEEQQKGLSKQTPISSSRIDIP